MTRLVPNRWLAPLALAALATVVHAQASGLLLDEGFDRALDSGRWDQVRVNDTRSDRIEAGDGRLTIALETIGTDDRTVKVRGVRSRDPFTLGTTPLQFASSVDWNSQANGCYLSAGMALVPEGHAADKDPRDAPEGLFFEWVGVPPGKNVRPYLARRAHNALIELYTEGWPQPKREDRTGRAPSKAKVTLEVAKDSTRLLEGDKELYSGKDGLSGKFRLVLFATGHSNYPTRTVYFGPASVAEVRSGS